MIKKSSSSKLPLTPSLSNFAKASSDLREKRGKLLIVGSVAFDSIETPFGKVNKALGGSASYFSLAASNFTRPSLVGAVGKDFTNKYRAILSGKNIDLSGLEQTAGQTFAWGGKYSFDLNNRETLFTRLGVFEKFQPKLSEGHKQSSYVFLGNIHPALQLEVLSQIQKPKFVGLDTMNLWIEKTPKLLAEVLKKINIFIINDSEARQLSGEHNLVKSAKKILALMGTTSPRPSPHHFDFAQGDPEPCRMGQKERETATLIIKRGEYGLLMFGKNQIFHLPGFPLEDVIDPTGAGDSFAGGMFGYLAKSDNPSWENLKRACVAGSVLASFCVEKLGTNRLQEIKLVDITRRFGEFKKLTNFN